MTSRSNWAKESSTLRVSRPMLEVVLKDWVIETKDTPYSSKSSTSLAKSASERVRRSTIDLIDHDDGDLAGPDVGEELLQGRAVEGGAREPAIVVVIGDQAPAL